MLNLTQNVYSILCSVVQSIPICDNGIYGNKTPLFLWDLSAFPSFTNRLPCLSLASIGGLRGSELIIILIVTAAVCLSASMFFVRKYFKRAFLREKTQFEEQLKRLEKEKAEVTETERNKATLFQTIFKEARVPLAMIDEPIDHLLSDSKTGSEPEAKRLLSMIKRNSSQLLKLSDQILDFEKLENDTLEVQIKQQDIVPDIKSAVKSFYFEAQKEQVEILVDCPYDALIVPVDSNKFNKIIVNLIANAFKRTQNNGEIRIEIGLTAAPDSEFKIKEPAPKYLKINIIDQGEAISEQMLTRIFNKPEKPEDNILSCYDLLEGGIGLYYAYRLIELQGGDIIAKSRRSKGMVFSFVLPLIQENSDSKEPSVESAERGLDPMLKIRIGDSEDNKTSVLIVEHDRELREQICSSLRPLYHLITADNGQDGLAKTLDLIPDIVICDALIPLMSGYELCDRIKANSNTSHIPVLLLTEKKGMTPQDNMTQADLYINKSTEIETIPAKIKKIVAQIQAKQAAQMNNSSPDSPENKPELSSFDQKFMDRLCASIDKDLSKPELNVNALGRSLGFSRTSFYRKIKALTGQTPNDFLRIYRLNKASELIKEADHSLSEIGELTGFGTHSHFSTCFKKHFGISPRNYRQSV